MKHALLLQLCFVAIAIQSLTAIAQTPAAPTTGPFMTNRLSLDRGWLFHLGDVPFPVLKGQDQSYSNAKAGTAWGAAAPDFDDSGWRGVDLPHDWAVEGPFDPNANLSQGYRQRGLGWYRRYFKLPATDRGRHIELQFDGVATHCTVWVNGVVSHRNFCGYTSFYIDITPFAKFGDDVNTVAVQVDADTMEGWWYEGAGIYRHTWLVVRDPVHIMTDGVYANPVRAADGSWNIPVEVTLNSSAKSSATVTVESVLLDPQGNEVARANTPATVVPFEDSVAKLSLAVSSPHLWSVDHPALYTVHTTISRDGATVDQTTTTCGFRTIRFDPNLGFFLNDQPLKLKGVCNHQDHAGVGVAVPDSLWDFRIRRLKEMGANAYRCAHNPPAAEFLAACDRLGMLVMDENRNFNTTDEYLRQLRWMVRRDRNHPSVILWSVFNEEPFQGSEQGFEMVREMSATVKQLDGTRPVTAAQSGGMLGNVNASQAADVAGFNYQPNVYDAYHKANPTKPITSSEDTSAVMTRGEFSTDHKAAIIASYDDDYQPWGTTHRNGWKQVATRPFVAGQFVWTGFDYRGEPQPLEWPATGSSFGCMDSCGFPKTAYFIHQAQWIDDKPILQLVPHWNWKGQEGKPIRVMAVSNADHVALFLNGKPLGEKPIEKYEQVANWQVSYEPGKLEAVGSRDGKEIARCVVETTGVPTALKLIVDRPALAGDGVDAEPVTVEAVDAGGRVVPNANPMVKFELSGSGEIIGLNNGNPNCHEPEKGSQHSLFNGLGQLIIQAGKTAGPLRLKATAEGLTASEVTIGVQATPERGEVPPVKATLTVGRWRMSPVSGDKPDPNQKLSKNDMNSWAPVQTGRLQKFAGGRFAVFRASFRPRSAVRAAGGKITFADLTGKAQVWVDGNLVGEKTTADPQTVSFPIPAGENNRTVNVLIESDPGTSAGLGGPVAVE